MRSIWPPKTLEGLAVAPAYALERGTPVILGTIIPVRDGAVAPFILDQTVACFDNLEKGLGAVRARRTP